MKSGEHPGAGPLARPEAAFADREPLNRSSALQLATQPLLLSAPNAALICGVSERTWWKLLVLGLVPKPVSLGRRRLWSRTVLEDWVASSCRPPTTERTLHGRLA